MLWLALAGWFLAGFAAGVAAVLGKGVMSTLDDLKAAITRLQAAVDAVGARVAALQAAGQAPDLGPAAQAVNSAAAALETLAQ